MTTRPAPDTSTEDGALQKRLRSDLALKASSSTSLFQIPSERDVLTDDDHGALDENIFKTFNSHSYSEAATVKSWNIEYVGNAADVLYEHLCYPTVGKYMYARYTSIVQSSGMGKSRAIDELSKKHLVVPLCLREGSNGFPPADENVRNWFLLYTGETKRTAYGRAGAFLW